MGVYYEIERGRVPPDFKLSYGVPMGLMYGCGSGYSALARWDHPSEVVLVADSASVIGIWSALGAPGLMAELAWAEGCAAYCDPKLRTEDHTRHSGGSNIAFGDGHAKWFRAQNCRVREFGGPLRLVGWFGHDPCATEL